MSDAAKLISAIGDDKELLADLQAQDSKKPQYLMPASQTANARQDRSILHRIWTEHG